MQTPIQVFRDEMCNHKLRITKNRITIFRILEKSGKPLSIQEIIKLADTNSHFTSIYRSIETMTQVGVLRVVPRGFKNLYELGESFQPHHHHATCEKCGHSVAINDANLEKMMRKLTMNANLVPTKHQFELFGVCKKCIK